MASQRPNEPMEISPSTDPATGEKQVPAAGSSRPDTRTFVFNPSTPSPIVQGLSASGAPPPGGIKKRKNFSGQQEHLLPGNDTEKMFLREQFAIQAVTIHRQARTIGYRTSEVAALREQITKMEKAQNKCISKVADTQKAIKTFAQVTGGGLPSKKTNPTVRRDAPAAAPAVQKERENKSSPAPSKRMRRVVVLIEGAYSTNNIVLRDSINKALKTSKAPSEVMVVAVSFNGKGNAILTLREGCTAHQLLKFRSVVANAFAQQKVKAVSIEMDQQWFKYKLHGVSTEEFSGEQGMQKLKDEIESFNPKLKLAQNPRWLTTEEKRTGKKFSSVVVAVHTTEEAKALKKGLWVSNKICKADEFVASRPTDQCGQCLNMGHHWKQCTTKPRCKICAGGHLSKDHYCKQCQKKGVQCGHTTLKCFNCGKGHMATHPRC